MKTFSQIIYDGLIAEIKSNYKSQEVIFFFNLILW